MITSFGKPAPDSSSRLERYQGCLLGLATGDALGTTLEFRNPGGFAPIDDIVGGGPFSLNPGEWTDDTSMALCLAESLIACSGFDARDQCERYVDWMMNGHLSSNGSCFDVGNTVTRALMDFRSTGNPYSGPSHKYDAGNGSIMRLAPISMFYADDPDQAIRLSGESSRTTHQATACIDACRYMGGILTALLNGESKEVVLRSMFHPMKATWGENDLCEEIASIANGSFKIKQPPSICGSGYVVQSLEAALWAFHHSTNFRDGALLAVNLGNDADTTGAVYGQLAGACYGIEGIPPEWREKISHSGLIGEFASRLYEQGSKRILNETIFKTVNHPCSVEEIIRLADSGKVPEYVFFWGHTPERNGEVTKSCFSQWWESPFESDGCVFPTAEHYMMAAKARLFGDMEAFDAILKAGHPKQAKDLGRSVTGFNEELWLEHRYGIVVAANEAKFRQNPQLSEFLLSTGDRILVEASPVDRVWGIGLAATDANAGSPRNWQGLNLLGFALMEVRERLISEIPT